MSEVIEEKKQILSLAEEKQISEKYGKIDFTHSGEEGYCDIAGKKTLLTEQYRTKHFVCYQSV